MALTEQQLTELVGAKKAREIMKEHKPGPQHQGNKRPIRDRESQDQQRVIREVERLRLKYPELALLFAIPNGGNRNVRVGVRLKAEGVRPGIPDLCLPVARQGYHGLYIEQKTVTGQVQPHQRRWHDALREQGYRVEVCWSSQETLDLLIEYLGLEDDYVR